MATQEYHLSVAEFWVRDYYIDAETPEAAWEAYQLLNYGAGMTSNDIPNVREGELTYVADMEQEKHIMWDEQGNNVEFLPYSGAHDDCDIDVPHAHPGTVE